VSVNLDTRVELARQRRAELLQQAERDRLCRALSADTRPATGRLPSPSQLLRYVRRNRPALPREAR
jgi:hypothetical protein